MLELLIFLVANQSWESAQSGGVVEVLVSKLLELATFAKTPSSNSVCTNNSDFITKPCESVTYQEHKVEIEEISNSGEIGETSKSGEGCKSLWFAGMHEGEGNYRSDGTGYQNMYGAALISAKLMLATRSNL
jgi:hypothetical protein